MALPVAASHTRAAVPTCGDHKFSIRAECRAINPLLMAQGLADGFARRRLPDPRRVVPLAVTTNFPSGLNAAL